jgi:drug/metabolite transporter (DMT)-like permease
MDRVTAKGLETRIETIAAFAAIYIIWGSTFIAIRFAIETIPPFLMAGTRLVLAGLPLFLWGLLRGRTLPSAADWLRAAPVGALLFLGGHGALSWSEQWVPTGMAALLLTTISLWLAILDSLHADGGVLDRGTVAGLVIGFLGVGLLVGPEGLLGGPRPDPIGTVVLLLGALSWAAGSVLSKRIERRSAAAGSSVLRLGVHLVTAMHLLTGGAFLYLLSFLTGELTSADLPSVSASSILALLYLSVFGSLVAFSAYSYLLRITTAARVGTYAYVNPGIAVLLGWWLADEPLTPRVLGGGILIVSAVVIILKRSRVRSTSGARTEPPAAGIESEPALSEPALSEPTLSDTGRLAPMQEEETS